VGEVLKQSKVVTGAVENTYMGKRGRCEPKTTKPQTITRTLTEKKSNNNTNTTTTTTTTTTTNNNNNKKPSGRISYHAGAKNGTISLWCAVNSAFVFVIVHACVGCTSQHEREYASKGLTSGARSKNWHAPFRIENPEL
jgi:hypothetical protein